MLAVDDAELGPAEVSEQVEVDAAELGRLRVDVEREHVSAGGRRRRAGVETRLDVRHFQRVAHGVDVAGDARAARTEDRRDAQTRLVAH